MYKNFENLYTLVYKINCLTVIKKNSILRRSQDDNYYICSYGYLFLFLKGYCFHKLHIKIILVHQCFN